MPRLAVALALSLALIPSPASSGLPITAEPVLTGLPFPASFTFLPDGSILYGERFTGNIRLHNETTGTTTTFFTVPNLATDGEQGLLGLAVHPDYPAQPYVYAFATRTTPSGLRNQILRITSNGATGSAMKIIMAAHAARIHNGGRILFGPDRHLYAVIGENGLPGNSQALPGTQLGKVLRMTDTGAVPASSPFGTRVWAYGIRNSFGMGFDPDTGRLWLTDNGPRCNDEINRIVRGSNYGWGPHQTCSTPPQPPVNTNQDGPNPVLPNRWFAAPPALTGIAFCRSCGLGADSEGTVFVAAFNTGEIRRFTLGPQRWSLSAQTVALDHAGRVLALERSPTGALYFSDLSGIYRLDAA
ncbi:MAG TPA: PQQ-dependent sugar dehydrogenase [Actinomycetota bacterium]|nr:PQQ-dependent sugar dehydrogenase [Actinomycetota bacterium]